MAYELISNLTGSIVPVGDAAPRYDDVRRAWITSAGAFAGDQGDYTPMAAPRAALLTPMQFYLAFTPTERIAIKKSTDPIVQEFWATYELASSQPGGSIDPNLPSVIEGLAYLATPSTATPAGPGILASAARIAQIQAGIAQ